MLKEAVELAGKADTVVLCLGEHRDHSGEAGSRANICIPQSQMQLLNAVYEVNQNIVTLVFSGRPLEVKEIVDKSKAVLMTWMPGTEGGNAIADVLFGDVAPQGKLSMCLPRTVAQAPIYYNKFRTGRPNHTGTRVGFVNGYIDESTKPLYPFGYGLTYTSFVYSPVCLNGETLAKEETLIAKTIVTNTGSAEGTETVQLYLQDVVGSVVRPVKMLRGVQKVSLKPGESKEVTFEIKEEMLRFYNIDMEYVSEPGECRVYMGTDSDTENQATFKLV